MKPSYVLTLLAGGFLSSGYHSMATPETAAPFFFLGIVALGAAACVSTWMERNG